MIGERLTSSAHAATHRATFAARADDAVADDANTAHVEGVQLVVDTDRAYPYVVGMTSVFWLPRVHERSMRPLGADAQTTWALWVNGRRSDIDHFTAEQVGEHLDAALALFAERGLEPAEHDRLLASVFDKLTSKTVQVEQVVPGMPGLAVPKGI